MMEKIEVCWWHIYECSQIVNCYGDFKILRFFWYFAQMYISYWCSKGIWCKILMCIKWTSCGASDQKETTVAPFLLQQSFLNLEFSSDNLKKLKSVNDFLTSVHKNRWKYPDREVLRAVTTNLTFAKVSGA